MVNVLCFEAFVVHHFVVSCDLATKNMPGSDEETTKLHPPALNMPLQCKPYSPNPPTPAGNTSSLGKSLDFFFIWNSTLVVS